MDDLKQVTIGVNILRWPSCGEGVELLCEAQIETLTLLKDNAIAFLFQTPLE